MTEKRKKEVKEKWKKEMKNKKLVMRIVAVNCVLKCNILSNSFF